MADYFLVVPRQHLLLVPYSIGMKTGAAAFYTPPIIACPPITPKGKIPRPNGPTNLLPIGCALTAPLPGGGRVQTINTNLAHTHQITVNTSSPTRTRPYRLHQDQLPHTHQIIPSTPGLRTRIRSSRQHQARPHAPDHTANTCPIYMGQIIPQHRNRPPTTKNSIG